MLIPIFLVIFIATVSYGAPRTGYGELEIAQPCNAELCKLPNCRCSSTSIPGDLNQTEIPQLVLLTFDGALNSINYPFYEQALFNRVNPDNCPVGTTFLISHEYTNYTMVHELWTRGFEIALHSITPQPPPGPGWSGFDYWKNISVEELHRQFADQLLQFEAFAKVPKSDIKGMRIPSLQLSGNNSFQMMKEAGLKYDWSWLTLTDMDTKLWPYTLEYKSIQNCPVSSGPTASFSNVWEIPVVPWTDNSGRVCAMVDSCIDIPTDEDGILEFMIKNFKRHYNENNKTPYGFYVHSSWFSANPNRFSAYLKFLDYLQTFKDVFLVNAQRALEWVQNPSTVENIKNSWPSCQPNHENQCQVNVNCALTNEKGDFRIFSKCGSDCPPKYPWLRNPLGDK